MTLSGPEPCGSSIDGGSTESLTQIRFRLTWLAAGGRLDGMSEVTRPRDAATAGDRQAAADLLPLVYDELRKLAAARMAGERPDHTLDATALVHYAWLRLGGDRSFESRSHFLRTAAEAMRRILVDHARARGADKRGGNRQRVPAEGLAAPSPDADLLDLDDALTRLAAEDPVAAQIVELHHFAGLSHDRAAETLGISTYLARQKWNYARAWLKADLGNT
jgi:RNA polymerase sigma factor (TIGR02999 family)